ncbi:hypothetical protein WKW80_20860 [Variovorax humicola]|uniref:Pyrrolo-quinoline quinone repeat domain-containing protein n=1 Tax=Variovorax humicola TaxID=1769758 RepID=A0ABU8W317_9BURK
MHLFGGRRTIPWRRRALLKAADYKQGYSTTHAPLIAGGVLIVGISVGEYGTRGFLDVGPEDGRAQVAPADHGHGQRAQRRHLEARHGRARRRPDLADRQLRSGPRPGVLGRGQWLAVECGHARQGHALCRLGSPLRPATGEGVWHFQFSPGDPYDYDGTNELVLADLPGTGSGKVLMQANRNGFFYVLDRTNGKMLSAKQLARTVNWATGIDPASTGRPIDTPMAANVQPHLGFEWRIAARTVVYDWIEERDRLELAWEDTRLFGRRRPNGGAAPSDALMEEMCSRQCSESRSSCSRC